MMLLGYEEEELKELKAFHTAKELAQQPFYWGVTYEMMKKRETEIKIFLEKWVTRESRVIFTGAGTSDYIGDTIKSHVAEKLEARVESIATTDIVASPEETIERDVKTLLVSFARSGNSPESIGAYSILQHNTEEIAHLVITCNEEGKLAKMAGENKNNFLILLPRETNDQGFAMTSSFSCMMLSALLFFDMENLERNRGIVDILMEQGSGILAEKWRLMKELSDGLPKRMVYLGAGCFHGLAQELTLKNMELTNGAIPTLHESVLGFRHGPKTFMDDSTLLLVLMSQKEYTNQYNRDLLKEIHGNQGSHKLVALDYRDGEDLKNICHISIGIGGKEIPEVYISFMYLLFGQMLALYNSIQLGISTDNPSPDGTVNRVVTGVTLYEYRQKEAE